MLMQAKCVLVGMELYTSEKTNKQYARCLLVNEGTTNPVTVLSNDLSILSMALYTPLLCAFSFNEKFGKLSLEAFEIAGEKQKKSVGE